jgi:ribosomal protein S18 acetylase RimI-like enzyme
MNASSLTIRPLHADDYQQWVLLWNAYLAFYEARLDPAITATTWERLLDAGEPVHGLCAADEGRLVGIVHAVAHRATWTQGWYLYLEDLFTMPQARGLGVGRALINAVYGMADEMGASRVYWLTHEANAQARALYDSVGHNAGFIQYRRAV